MITTKESICPRCDGQLRYYDSVSRIVRTKWRITKKIKIRRLRCVKCGSIHRELPHYIFPYKQYESEVIFGVLTGCITPETLGFEDYPCEITMVRWKLDEKLCTSYL